MQFFSFAQWQYHNQWGSPEVWLLLVENFNQYPATMKWNTFRRRQFLIAPIGACKTIEMNWPYPIKHELINYVMFYRTPRFACYIVLGAEDSS